MLAAGTRGEPMESQMDRVMKAQLSLGEAKVKKQQARERREKEAAQLYSLHLSFVSLPSRSVFLLIQ